MVGAFALLILATAQPARAGVILYQATLTANGPIDPLPPYGVVGAADSLQVNGSATAISGFSSLTSVTPANLTFSITGLYFDAAASSASFPYSGTTGVSVYQGRSTPALLDFFLNGTPIAEFTGVTVTNYDDFSQISLGVATTTGEGQGNLDGLYTSAFAQDILNQSGGEIFIGIDPFNAYATSLPTTFQITGDFSTAGVPEPGSLFLLSCGGIGMLLIRYGLRKVRNGARNQEALSTC